MDPPLSPGDEGEVPPVAMEEYVPPTQFSQQEEEEAEEPLTPIIPTSRRGLLFSTPAKRSMAQRGSGDHDDDNDDGNDMEEEEVVALTPAVPSSVVRRPGLEAAGGAGGDDGDDDDGDGDDDWMRGVPSPLSRNRSSRDHDDDDDDDDDDTAAREDDTNNNHDNGPTGDDHDDEEGGEEETNTDGAEDPATLIRGTDVHVQSAAAAFRDFIRTFVSVEESERVVANPNTLRPLVILSGSVMPDVERGSVNSPLYPINFPYYLPLPSPVLPTPSPSRPFALQSLHVHCPKHSA